MRTKKKATKKKSKPSCLACAIPQMSNVAHDPECKVGRKMYMNKVVPLLNELARHYMDEEGDMYGETYEIDPFELHDVLINLTVFAFAEKKGKKK